MQTGHHELGLKLIIMLLLLSLLGWWYVKSIQAPLNQQNLCLLFQDHPNWYWATQDAEKKWGVPISVQMAVMQKESHFRAAIETRHQRVLGLLPWQHISSAKGYSQALDGTWRAYLHATHQKSASRSDFTNAADFLGWYIDRLHRATGIARNDAFRLYLAYHEGAGGYLARSYLAKPWLINIAHHVSGRAQRYHRQLVHCHHSLPAPRSWWHFWS